MYNFEQEVDEAIEAGELALASINKALEKLGNARGWGIFDMLGGGFISSILKHSNMNDAKYYIEQAKRDLDNFSDELKDVNILDNIHIETNDFLTFADTFFDGFIFDFLLQDRINEARYKLSDAKEKIERIIKQLKRNA